MIDDPTPFQKRNNKYMHMQLPKLKRTPSRPAKVLLRQPRPHTSSLRVKTSSTGLMQAAHQAKAGLTNASQCSHRQARAHTSKRVPTQADQASHMKARAHTGSPGSQNPKAHKSISGLTKAVQGCRAHKSSPGLTKAAQNSQNGSGLTKPAQGSQK